MATININGTTGPDNITVPEDTRPNIPIPGAPDGFFFRSEPLTNIVNGLAGDDTINGSTGNDSINGDDGNDQIYGNGGQDTLNGGIGDDLIRSLSSIMGGSLVDGGDGNDLIYGGSFGDTLNGGNGNDTISSSPFGRSLVNGGDGNDLIDGDGSDNTLNGGDGDDTISSSRSYGDIFVDGGDGNDSITISSSFSSPFPDIGISVPATIYDSIGIGGNGDDRFNLYLSGDNHSVTLDGGEGNDTLGSIYYNGAKAIVVDINNINKVWNVLSSITIKNVETLEFLQTGDGNDIITDSGSLGHRISTRGGDDQIFGGTGNDSISAGSGNDLAFSGAGADIISGNDGIDNLEGNEGNDTIFGDEGDDGLAGQEGDDSLVGGNGNDRLYGWLGNDVLIGDAGSDTLYGDSGNDRLTGGSEADTFNFGSDFVAGAAFNSLGLDTITDFQSGLDKIQLQRSAFSVVPETLSFATVADDSLAATRSEIIVYSQGTGSIFYNANGAAAGFGDGGSFAQLTGNPSLAATDFDLLPATGGGTGFPV
jgi:Ca2+-binding RTX toxin-like protein